MWVCPMRLLDLQGLPECAPGPVMAANGGIKRDLLTGADILDDPCGNYNITKAGTMNEEEYRGSLRPG